MQIFGPYRVTTPQNPPQSSSSQPKRIEQSRGSAQPVDQLDLSAEAQQLGGAGAAQESPTVEGIRFEKVTEIRRQIADGSYDTDEKLDAALDRLLDQIA